MVRLSEFEIEDQYGLLEEDVDTSVDKRWKTYVCDLEHLSAAKWGSDKETKRKWANDRIRLHNRFVERCGSTTTTTDRYPSIQYNLYMNVDTTDEIRSRIEHYMERYKQVKQLTKNTDMWIEEYMESNMSLEQLKARIHQRQTFKASCKLPPTNEHKPFQNYPALVRSYVYSLSVADLKRIPEAKTARRVQLIAALSRVGFTPLDYPNLYKAYVKYGLGLTVSDVMDHFQIIHFLQLHPTHLYSQPFEFQYRRRLRQWIQIKRPLISLDDYLLLAPKALHFLIREEWSRQPLYPPL